METECHSARDAYSAPERRVRGAVGVSECPVNASKAAPELPNLAGETPVSQAPGQSEGWALGLPGRQEEKGGFVSAAQSAVSSPPTPADKEQKAADAKE